MLPQCTELCSRLRPWAPLFIRLPLGVIFFAHGADKLFGWYGGGGFNATVSLMKNLNIEPASLMAALSGGGELLGGILVFFGLLTPLGAFLIASTMVVAIITVHWQGGLFARDNGFEYPLAVLGAALSLICSGAGSLSVDSILKCSLGSPKSEQ
jgi:putative oxidoreductase